MSGPDPGPKESRGQKAFVIKIVSGNTRHVPTWEQLNRASIGSRNPTCSQSILVVGITDTTFSWINAPYPLPYMPTAQYELELLPENPPAASDGASNGQTSLAKSDLFYIIHSSSEEDGGSRNPTVITEPHPTTEPTKSRGGPSTAIIIVAVCVGLGVPILAGIGVWIWCMRRERRRRQYEESRRIRYQTIID
ncbi:unnamed protein product [Parascedosporium putredinis]|uniref:Mid2 domain-containing protein n=1 Tax=Parascedosporium putredinis TaxID=1442378 RepID=A0A9P1MBC4_9PEZI|nr:unnamed protein product [Parascedosporium putredinis]CAI7995666.1 unnamed protein product [Parascedosporium putredinis]